MSFFKLRKLESIAVIVGVIASIYFAISQLPQKPGNTENQPEVTVQDKITQTSSAAPSVPNTPNGGDEQGQPAFVAIPNITSAMQGKTIDTRGIVTDLNEGKGNVYFNLKDPKTGKEIRCVMFAKTNNADPNRKNILLRSRDNNSVVKITGEIDVYEGELEIKVWEVEAVDEPATSNEPVSFVEVSQITSAMKGMTKNTRGIVTILNEGKGNVYFNLKDPKTGKEIRCVMFAKTNNDNFGRKDLLLRSRDNNSVINVKGEVDVYKGELEIKVWQVYQ